MLFPSTVSSVSCAWYRRVIFSVLIFISLLGCGSSQKRSQDITYSPFYDSLNRGPVSNLDQKQLLSQADVIDNRWKQSDRRLSLVESLEMRCPDGFDYGKPQKTKMPSVSCKFISSAENGYNCSFFYMGKPLTLLVTPDNSESKSEVVSNELTRMIGFAHPTSCPAKVKCEGCKHQGHPEYATSIVNIPFPGLRKTSSPLAWKSLTNASSGGAEDRIETVLMEREALLLWQSILLGTSEKETHSTFHLYCDQNCSKVTAVAQPLAAFKDLTSEQWITQKIFKNENSCELRGIAAEGTISEEARKWLLDRMRQISRANLQDLFAIAGLSEKNSTPALWATGFYEKAIQLAALEKIGSCKSLKSEKSILGQPLPIK